MHACSPEARLKLLKSLNKEFHTVVCSDVGTHPMQRMIEMISTDEERELVIKYIKKTFKELMLHAKGNYAILAAIDILKTK